MLRVRKCLIGCHHLSGFIKHKNELIDKKARHGWEPVQMDQESHKGWFNVAEMNKGAIMFRRKKR